MPRKRLERARATLPDGYQFGDASTTRGVFLDGFFHSFDLAPLTMEITEVLDEYLWSDDWIARERAYIAQVEADNNANAGQV